MSIKYHFFIHTFAPLKIVILFLIIKMELKDNLSPSWEISSEELEKMKMTLRGVVEETTKLLVNSRQNERLVLNLVVNVVGCYNEFATETRKGGESC